MRTVATGWHDPYRDVTAGFMQRLAALVPVRGCISSASMACSHPKPGPGRGLLGAPRMQRQVASRDHSILRAPSRQHPCAWLSERAGQRQYLLSGPRRGAPSRGACPHELGPPAHKTAGSGFERRTPARRAKAREGLRKRLFEIDMEHCSQRSGTLTIIAAIEHPPVITKVLTHLGLPARAPPRAAASALDGFQQA